MSKGMDNFRQAARELFGGESPRAEEQTPFPHEPEQTAQPHPPQDGEAFAPDGYGPQSAQDAGPVQEDTMAVFEPQKELSIISEGTVIKGRIQTDGHLEIRGRVDGNVDAGGNVRISGKILGAVKGGCIELYGAHIRGDLNAGSAVLINRETVVVGDVRTDYLVFDGKLKGDVTAGASVTLNSNAYLVGDITAQSLAIDSGAVVNGTVKTASRIDEDSVFDSF